MFKDQKEELRRIEEALLAEEPEVQPEEPEEETDFPWEDEEISNEPVVYQNYSNRYGENLRNYASGYRAYNRDRTDGDLESYSQDVWEGKRSGGCLGRVLITLVVLGIIGALAWGFLRYGGLV